MMALCVLLVTCPPKNDPGYVTYVHLLKMKVQDSEVLIYKDSTESFKKVMQWPVKKVTQRRAK